MAARTMTWHVKEYGEPTEANLNKVVEMFERSLLPGGGNAHLGIHSVLSANIVDNVKGKGIVGWRREIARPNEPIPADIKADREVYRRSQEAAHS